MESIHIGLRSFDLFDRIGRIHRHPPANPENIQSKYVLLYKVLEDAAYELTAHTGLSFSNLFSRLDFIGKAKKMTPSDRYAIQTMRRNCNRAAGKGFRANMEDYLYDLRALLRFVSSAFDAEIPAFLLEGIPSSNRPYPERGSSHIPYVRGYVASWTDSLIFASCESGEEPFIVIDYRKGGYDGDLLYIRELLKENMSINLLDVKVDEEGHYVPKLIVAYPDYLVDISSLAACFREYGHHPLNYFLNKLKPKANTHHILMGNLASRFLDDIVNEPDGKPVSYADTVNKFFASSALEFCACDLPDDFHVSARKQMENIRSFVHKLLPANVPGFDRRNVLLEASLICEKLGLQGRADMLQKDFKVLVEQKSGKMDEWNHRHKEDHFVQMMLYQGALMCNFGQKAKDMQTFLLYSKYADGLMMEHFSEKLFRESISLRNRIVAQEMDFAEGGIRRTIEGLTTDLLNELNVHNKLWVCFQQPELQALIDTLKQCSPLEKAYFDRFFTFVSKEMLLNKVGGNGDPSRGFAGTWHNPMKEKVESGNILAGLTILNKGMSAPGKGYDLIELAIPQQEDDFLPNFRTGDIVVFYAYRDEPDVRDRILMKGNILDLRTDRLTLQLRNGQQNKDVIGSGSETFCVEHDSSDISSANAIRGLYAFLCATAGRRQLLLGQRPPCRNTERTLNGDYGDFNPLVLKEKQADDYFLLVGPPGTGKTSCALRYMLEETLAEPGISILLLSYTNRAVDEICQMLTDSGIAARFPFIRIGHEMSCDRRFRRYLLKNSLSGCPKLADIRRKIADTRIFVGTTTAVSNRMYFLGIKRFDVAFIDEASQILEPDLIGILSARNGGGNAIGKFVLIGDYKQLPAIALQSREEATVTDPLLQAIGLDDCRNSLFERLCKQCPQEFRSVLHKQGRMHPDIADFPNHAFYPHEHLEPVPLVHQEEPFPYRVGEAHDNIDRLLLNRRMVFVPAEAPDDSAVLSDKANINEARIVASLLKHIYGLTAGSFDPDRTVGVIVPYRNQIAMVRRETALLGIPALNDISIDTVERYQGSQRDVIVYSFTVRNISQLNFLTESTFREGNLLIDRKLNVAVTRAKKQLLLTGNPQVLGTNFTFYKLMEHVRAHNGYIETTTDKFCRGDFCIPEYETGWELKGGTYCLPETFSALFEELVGKPSENTDGIFCADDTEYRELAGYGRMDFHHVAKEDAMHCVQTYNRYFMRRQFMAAKSAFELCGNRLRRLMGNVSGRVVFCDFSCESGASALAFAEICRGVPHIDLTVAEICPMKELAEVSEKFFKRMFPNLPTFFLSDLQAVGQYFRASHPALPGLVVFHFGNLFGLLPATEAESLAREINRMMYVWPMNRYAVFFRDDNGLRACTHSYRVFCTHLAPQLRSLHGGMPFVGKVCYNESGGQGCPPYDSFLYELRTDEKTGL